PDTVESERVRRGRVGTAKARKTADETRLADQLQQSLTDVVPPAERVGKQSRGLPQLPLQLAGGRLKLRPHGLCVGGAHVDVSIRMATNFKALRSERAQLIPVHPARLPQQLAVPGRYGVCRQSRS